MRGENVDTVLEETEELLRVINPACKYKVSLRPAPSEASRYYKPYVVPESNPYVVKIQEAIAELYGQKATIDYLFSVGDFNYIGTRLDNAATLIIGPDGGNIHQSDEFVDVGTIGKTVDIVERFLEKTLL